MLGILLLIAGVMQVVKELKSPVSDKAQYDLVDHSQAAVKQAAAKATSASAQEEVEEFVYHFTGKMNQSQVMKTLGGEIVYEAICEKVTMMKDTPFRFVNHLTGENTEKRVSHTVTVSSGIGAGFSANISSVFQVDGVSVWEVLAEMGYGFRFSMNGLLPHYEVEHWNEPAGFAESAGTGLMNPKYANNPLGKVPAKGIYRVRCKRSDLPGFFLICFALSRTDETLS